MGHNALGQSDSRILKSNVSQEQKDKMAWFFCVFIQIHGN